MWFPLLIAAASVVLGTVLALGTTRKSFILGPIQTFAFVAAGTVVFAELLPDALTSIGAWALLAFVISLALPSLLEWIIKKSRNPRKQHVHRDSHIAGVELGYVGLVVHQFVEGCGLGIYGGANGAHTMHLDVVLALCAHIIPVTSLFMLTIARLRGRRSALIRSAILVTATSLGILVSSQVEYWGVGPLLPWVSAAMSGFLLHVVLHDWSTTVARNNILRSLDFFAIIAGLSLVLLLGQGSNDHGANEQMSARIGDAFWALSFETAPTLLLGLVIAALLQSFGARLPSKWLHSQSRVKDALRGATLGAPLPVCSCGVLPITEGLQKRNASIAFVVAFLIATPELGVETFALTAGLMGWPFALVRLTAAIAVAVSVALIVSFFDGGYRKKREESAEDEPKETTISNNATQTLFSRTMLHIDDLLVGIGPFVLLGLIAASYIEAVLPTRAFHIFRGSGLDVVLLSLLAMPSYVCATSSTPIVVVLLAKGISPGAALAVLLLGPATNIATVGFLRKAYGGRTAMVILASLFGCTWLLCYGLNAGLYFGSSYLSNMGLSPSSFAVVEEHIHSPAHGVLTYLGVCVLLLLVARNLWSFGLRPWIHTLGSMIGSHEHEHTLEKDAAHTCC